MARSELGSGSNPSSPGISVVIPVYGDGECLPEIVARIDRVRARFWGPESRVEVILVDDGSPGESWSVIQQLANSFDCVVGVRLARNYGQHAALLAGIRQASLPLTATLDDDLQNPPEALLELVRQLESENLDVVYGVPVQPRKRASRRLGSWVIRKTMQEALGMESGSSISSYRLFRTHCRDAFAGNLGPGVSVDALLTWSTVKFGQVSVPHEERRHGSSTYTLAKLLRLAGDAVTGYSTRPLRIVSLVGVTAGVLGLVSMTWTVGRALIAGSSVPGFPFLASTVAFFAGVQLIFLGVMGEYLARTHSRVMEKPTYVVREKCNGLTDSN